ncbi:hypothetical protein IFM89_021814 [Coptis chinensis]|uniref:Uncharacterized protein n=1 Tax=Coptis chinensis TaxID=261450 RepID=A0A835HNM3_9MAGN|nr:hypothetical protein IFM89_021814 [Coptis chinensis]
MLDEEMAEIQATCILHLPFSPTKNNNNSRGKTTCSIAEFKKIYRVITKAKKLGNSLTHVCCEKALNMKKHCNTVWTEYDEMSKESIREVAGKKAYTVKSFLDLLRFVAPKMMHRAEGHFSHGIAEDLDDPKYSHYKY